MSFGTIRRTIHIESVFALSESENVAVFKRIKDNEQHSFLFRLCGQEVLYPVIPHIYSSVGYCIVYLIQVRHNLQIDRRNNLTLSFCTNPSFEVDDTTLSVMTQEISLKDKIGRYIKALTGVHARNAIGVPCICEKVTGEIIITPVFPEKSDESNIDQWTEIIGTAKAYIKIAPDIIERNISIDFICSTENCKVISLKSITAQTTTINSNK